jgi:hypothetical protein
VEDEDDYRLSLLVGASTACCVNAMAMRLSMASMTVVYVYKCDLSPSFQVSPAQLVK